MYFRLEFENPDEISRDDKDFLRITFGFPYTVYSNIGTPLASEDQIQEIEIPSQIKEVEVPPVAESI